MSSRKQKKRKINSNIKPSNETPDVLVLPPKLLQKLGISLRNIDRIQEDQNVHFKGILYYLLYIIQYVFLQHTILLVSIFSIRPIFQDVI